MTITSTPYLLYKNCPWDNSKPFELCEEGRSGFACVPENMLSNVQVTSADPEFPVKNVLDEHPKRICRAAAGVNTVTYTAVLPAGVSSLCLFNTNAENVNIRSVDFSFGRWREGDTWRTGDQWRPENFEHIPASIVESGGRNAIGIKFTPLTINQKLVITLSAPAGVPVELGVLWAGKLVEVNNPLHGWEESQHDYSIEKDLSNGAYYYNKKDIVGTFSGQIIDAPQWVRSMLRGVSKKYGRQPMPFFLTNGDAEDWLVFGRLVAPMKAAYRSHDFHGLQFSILEVF